ncbi:hypothetical protein Y1Q_0011415 [Alligator mississippiensis]|uniref:Uncharacterized protein n=1 Tax=Alligator mississippiensis TaxID=8496 RepID=A0A151PJ27_ALLMI|nr:hypothetical protein Y1Q_0011415 [Alligator mississippiensis]
MAEEVLVLAQGQFQLSRALGTGNCSLLIQDTCWGNAGTYYFRMEQGENELNYHSRAGYPEPHVLVTEPVPWNQNETLTWTWGYETLGVPNHEGPTRLELHNLSAVDTGAEGLQEPVVEGMKLTRRRNPKATGE